MLVMALLLMVMMIRRHGWLLCRELMVALPVPTAPGPFTNHDIGSGPCFCFESITRPSTFSGKPLFLIRTVSLVRRRIWSATLFASIDPTEAVRKALVWLVGLDLGRVMMGLYNTMVVSLFGRSGASEPFLPVFSGSGSVGFGPVAALLVLPALAHAWLRGPRRLKALSVAWAGYLYLGSADHCLDSRQYRSINAFLRG